MLASGSQCARSSRCEPWARQLERYARPVLETMAAEIRFLAGPVLPIF